MLTDFLCDVKRKTLVPYLHSIGKQVKNKTFQFLSTLFIFFWQAFSSLVTHFALKYLSTIIISQTTCQSSKKLP